MINTDINTKSNFIDKQNFLKKKNYNEILQKDFINLLITQIKNQDPINPIKNSELINQLAVIKTNSNLEKINNQIEQIKEKNKINNIFNMSSLIGKKILVPSIKFKKVKNMNLFYGIELFKDTKMVNLKIIDVKNRNNQFIKHLKNMKKGIHFLSMDEKNFELPVGTYEIKINEENNSPKIGMILNYSVIQGITNPTKEPIINLSNTKNVNISDIKKIF
ncbi:MAG: flagellar hook assembly protein FlgD [Buchnera aphidicola (Tetraneura akinire)]|nr:flagellar hook capping FlgD N-terminal domain-containing protein [Buchnera sp. (in: enterobacteria)]